MSKRFTETTKWADPWYRRLTCIRKVFWLYICDNCDNAGVWKVDYELASFHIGAPINEKDLLSFNESKERVRIEKEYAIIQDFIPFQIGNLAGENLTNLQKNCLILIGKYKKRGISLTGKLRVSYPKRSGIGKGIGKGISKGKDKEENKPEGLSLSDQNFILSLKKNPAYKGIDIDHEFSKMDAWLSTRPGRKKTRRFIVNWLNKIDKPVNTGKTQCAKCKGIGKYISATGYEIRCSCPAGYGVKLNNG